MLVVLQETFAFAPVITLSLAHLVALAKISLFVGDTGEELFDVEGDEEAEADFLAYLSFEGCIGLKDCPRPLSLILKVGALGLAKYADECMRS